MFLQFCSIICFKFEKPCKLSNKFFEIKETITKFCIIFGVSNYLPSQNQNRSDLFRNLDKQRFSKKSVPTKSYVTTIIANSLCETSTVKKIDCKNTNAKEKYGINFQFSYLATVRGKKEVMKHSQLRMQTRS